eukprot:TRINITY_DN3926_c0_g1_i1.p1 TRINITY_DN3926_c0_g1~~TRINITY_DN3926_c0_g1_i1.p1  ORF type:complete len:285 (+),score=52.03 TRINITY_DN3926_c0_g1_i1:139-993(+)
MASSTLSINIASGSGSGRRRFSESSYTSMSSMEISLPDRTVFETARHWEQRDMDEFADPQPTIPPYYDTRYESDDLNDICVDVSSPPVQVSDEPEVFDFDFALQDNSTPLFLDTLIDISSPRDVELSSLAGWMSDAMAPPEELAFHPPSVALQGNVAETTMSEPLVDYLPLVDEQPAKRPKSIKSKAKLKSKSKPKGLKGKPENGLCDCCKDGSSPMWREGPNANGKATRICNACGIRWHKYSGYCPTCLYIPRKQEAARGICPHDNTPFEFVTQNKKRKGARR